MPTCSATFDLEDLENVFSDFFPRVNKHIQLNILLRKWENKQRNSKQYWNEKFIHDGFLSDNSNNNVLYIINNKDLFLKRVHLMQDYITKNSITPIGNSDVTYMLLTKTHNKNIDINEYSKKYKKLILAELDILRPVLIVVCDGNYKFIKNLIHNKRYEKFTSHIRYSPILDMSPLDMTKSSKKEYLLYFKYLYDKNIVRW